MPSDPTNFDREVADFQDRLEELRSAHALRPQDDPVVVAAFLELETAAEELRVAHEELATRGEEVSTRQPSADRDRQLTRAVFRELPLPMFLLDREGRIRRLNNRAAEVLSTTTDYASGKPLPAFIELSVRAAFRSGLAAVLRGLGEQILVSGLLRDGTALPVRLMLSLVHIPSDPRPLVGVLVLPTLDPLPAPPEPAARNAADSDAAVRSTTRRMDLMSAMTRILLDEQGRTEASTVQAAADLLCAELADWVIVDLLRRSELTRAAVCGPTDSDSLVTASALERAPVGKGELPCAVIDGDGSVLHAHLEDMGLLGEDNRGVPFLAAMGAHSILCLPLVLDGEALGAITAVRTIGQPPFGLLDMALLQDMAGHLARALRTERRFRRRNDLVSAVRDRLMPPTLRTPPGVEIASVIRSADENDDLVGDFFDVFESEAGWGVALGDAEGTGEPAAGQASIVRNAIRVFALSTDDPAQWLRLADEAVRRLPDSDRTVRVVTGRLRPSQGEDAADGLEVTLASAGNPSSLLVRADGRVQRVDGGGQPLGGSDGPNVHVDSVVLAPHDCLLLFSPALLETRNADGELFEGSGVLARALARASGQSAATIVTALDNELISFAPDGRIGDVAVIALCSTAGHPTS